MGCCGCSAQRPRARISSPCSARPRPAKRQKPRRRSTGRRFCPWLPSWRRSASGSGSARSPSRTGSRGEARRRGPRTRWGLGESPLFGSPRARGSSRFPRTRRGSCAGACSRPISTRSKTSSRPKGQARRSLSTWPTRGPCSSSCSHGSRTWVRSKPLRSVAYSLSGTRFGLICRPRRTRR